MLTYLFTTQTTMLKFTWGVDDKGSMSKLTQKNQRHQPLGLQGHP
jgi:hypothetical protein